MASTTFNPSHKDDRKGNQPMEKAKEAGGDAMDKVKEAGTDALGKAREVATSVGEMASQSVSAAGKRADDMSSAAGHEIREFGANMAKKMPQDGIAGKASQVVTDTIKEGGKYLEDNKLSGMAQDVENVVKNHPIPALLLVLGIGYCLGRAMRD